MTKFRLVLVLLCLGSLGASAQPPVQGQMAPQQQTMRAEVGAPLKQAQQLIVAGEYKKALAVVDGLKGVPNKTAYENSVIGQFRQLLTVKMSGLPDQQAR